jgi:hypothetical protein
VAGWIDIAVTVLLGVVGLYLANSIRRQIQARVAEKRFDSYGKLWAELKVASPLRRVTGEGPLSQDERHTLYGKLTDWYYDSGNGMLLSQETRNIYLAAKENLICEVDALKPASLQKQVQASDDPDTIRGWASIRQFSLLRTAMRGDIAIYPRELMTLAGGGAMAQRGGPWRLAGYAMTEGRAARGSGGTRDVAAEHRERVLRWIVSAYVLAVVGGILIALVGLTEGWW